MTWQGFKRLVVWCCCAHTLIDVLLVVACALLAKQVAGY